MSDIVKRIERQAGVPGLASILTERVKAPDLQSLLLEVYRAPKIGELEALRDDLTECIGCGCLSLERCALYNTQDEVAREGPGNRRRPAGVQVR